MSTGVISNSVLITAGVYTHCTECIFTGFEALVIHNFRRHMVVLNEDIVCEGIIV